MQRSHILIQNINNQIDSLTLNKNASTIKPSIQQYDKHQRNILSRYTDNFMNLRYTRAAAGGNFNL
jgi:hypothetical protein